MKKNFFESTEQLHKIWLEYASKYDINDEVEPLLPLLNDPSAFSRTENQILDALYNSALIVLESTPKLETQQKTRALYFQYNLCTCEACNKECGAHINKKGQIRISKKFFSDRLQSPPPNGLIELIYVMFHQILHGIFPEIEEDLIAKKTEEIWKSGITELVSDKLKNT
ncbi:hypothetical protein KJN74_01845 [Candidatus Bathyarchaeota archaeon]|nr:hypothetical protein [Candidatus Bathyarchaeota archaeon]